MPFILAVGIAAWLFFGNGARTIADWFYPKDAAPWETVDAFYYPDRGDLTKQERLSGLTSIEACKAAVKNMALRNNDPRIEQGDYECGVGHLTGNYGGLAVYRVTVR